MNSITTTNLTAPKQSALSQDAALNRLGAWIDAEIGCLEDLLAFAGQEDAKDDFTTLPGLHLEAAATQDDVRRLLEDATWSLNRLLKCVREITFADSVEESCPQDFDAWVRWSGARLQDIIVTLDRALAA